MNQDENYEFDADQNKTILSLAKTLQFVGAVTYVLGFLLSLSAAYALFSFDWGQLIVFGMYAVFFVSMGNLMIRSGKAFESIVSTSGNDIEYLMDALKGLARMYSILSVIVILCVLLLIVGFAITLLFGGGAGPA